MIRSANRLGRARAARTPTRTARRLSCVVLVVAACCAPASAQEDVLKPKSASPYEIARVVNHSRRLWDRKQMRVEVDLSETWAKLGIEPSFFVDCTTDCEAKVFRHDLDGRRGDELLLKLTKSYDFCRYVVFKRVRGARGRDAWRPLGFVDHEFNRYRMSSHRVARAFGRSWLVVRGQGGSGSGFALYGETWYEAGARGVRPVVHYHTEGHTYPCLEGLDREFKAAPVTPTLRAGRRALVVRYTVKYGISDCTGATVSRQNRLFTNTHRAVYVWDAKAREFAYSDALSDISGRELDAVANVETEDGPEDEGGVTIGGTQFYSNVRAFVGGGYEVFLKYNLRRLGRVARGRDGRRREWLRRFLDNCMDTPEKLSLARAFRD